MTTGRINQVAILGHTSGPGAACSDSTLSARLRGRAPPAELPDLKRTRGPRDHGGATSVTGNGPTTRACKTAEHRLGGHCAAPRARRHEGVAGRAPPHRVPKPADTRLNGTVQAAARKHAVDMDTSGQTKGVIEVRGAPKAGSVPRTRLRLP